MRKRKPLRVRYYFIHNRSAFDVFPLPFPPLSSPPLSSTARRVGLKQTLQNLDKERDFLQAQLDVDAEHKVISLRTATFLWFSRSLHLSFPLSPPPSPPPLLIQVSIRRMI